MNTIPVAAVQMKSGPDKSRNMKMVTSLVTEAAHKGARMIALPELFSWKGSTPEISRQCEPIPGPTSRHIAELAAKLKIFLLCGSIIERNPHGPRPFNTSFLINPAGRIIGRYRKIHLFKARLESGKVLDERSMYAVGSSIVTAPTPLGRLGFSICYDLRFPELYRCLVDQGAVMIAVPSAFTFETGKAHWEVLLRARATENQVYVIAPNQHGKDSLGTRHYGHSMIVDPWGTVIASCPEGDAIIYGKLDRTYLQKVRKNLPSLRQRKKAVQSTKGATP
jgi:predicted amidohydrolase